MPFIHRVFFLSIALMIFISNDAVCQNKKNNAPSTSTSQKTGLTAKPVTRILFVLDASSSMMNPWEGKTKIDVARSIIGELADSLKGKADVQTALRVYGHQSINTANDCNDSKLEVSFATGNAAVIKETLNNIRPKGITPLAYSLEQSAADFPSDPSSRNIVILVTDGEESCSGDPCAVSLRLQQQHIYLKPFIIGLNLDPSAKNSMECIGNYFNADRPSALKEIMTTVINRILSSASVRINLLDANGNPLETDVAITFYNEVTGDAKYSFYHTLNYRGIPDTLQIDPVPDYNLMIHTIPPIEKDHLQFSDKKNEVVNIPASQGFLKVELTSNTINNNLNSKIKCLVKKSGSAETLMVQDMNTTIKYLSGKYDLEVLTLPRMEIKNVEITQSSTTTVKIDVPGLINIVKTFPGFGSIFINDKNGMKKIYELNENLTNELIGLQAGEYVISYRPNHLRKRLNQLQKHSR